MAAPVTNLINDQAEYDDTDRERPDAGPKEFSCLDLVQAEGAWPERALRLPGMPS